MGWSNGPRSWKEFHSRLADGRPRNVPVGADGDSPAWSRKRQPYEPPAHQIGGSQRSALLLPRTPYAELHCHTAYSFLDGASHPEQIAEEAARLGLDALAITDHDGMYGIVRFAEAARAVGLKTIFGAELGVGATRIPNGIADPEGDLLVVLARDPFGYA